jgi:hypothetical protein
MSNAITTCPTCTRPLAAPYRRRVHGYIVEGCIDGCHSGHVEGADREWHMRDAAIEHRRVVRLQIEALLEEYGPEREDDGEGSGAPTA